MTRPLPPMTHDTEAWWDATRDHRLLVQRCDGCGHHQHYPRPVCTACASTALSFVEAAGGGTVYSFTTVHRAPSPDFEAPYVVALVRLDEGPQLLTNLVGALEADLRCDDRVALSWEPLDDGRNLPVFTPTAR